MKQGRTGLAIASTLLLLGGSIVSAKDTRAEDRVATVSNVEINERTAVLSLSDHSVLEVPISGIRVRRERGRAPGGERGRAAASRSAAASRREQGVLRAEELKKLVETEGAQPLLIRVKYDNQGRIRSVRAEIHASEAAATAALARRTAVRAEAAALPDGAVAQD